MCAQKQTDVTWWSKVDVMKVLQCWLWMLTCECDLFAVANLLVFHSYIDLGRSVLKRQLRSEDCAICSLLQLTSGSTHTFAPRSRLLILLIKMYAFLAVDRLYATLFDSGSRTLHVTQWWANLKSNLKSRNNKKALANIFQFYWFRPMVTIGFSIFGAALLRALISPFKASPDNNR